MDYRIDNMKHTDGGYQVATVTSFFDQKQYQLHNRWGSWFIGDPQSKGGREPATISRALPFDLQDYLHKSKGSQVEAAPPPANVFVKKATNGNTNPFVQKAMNPFVAKATTKANPFILKAKKA